VTSKGKNEMFNFTTIVLVNFLAYLIGL
jgi:hypothetical protein